MSFRTLKIYDSSKHPNFARNADLNSFEVGEIRLENKYYLYIPVRWSGETYNIKAEIIRVDIEEMYEAGYGGNYGIFLNMSNNLNDTDAAKVPELVNRVYAIPTELKDDHEIIDMVYTKIEYYVNELLLALKNNL